MMNILSSLVGFFTGGSKTSDSVIDSVKRAGDMLLFTPEEKAISNQKGLELFIKYQEATLPQNVTRRMIAIVVVMLWGFIVFLTIILALIGLLFDFGTFKSAGEYLFKFLKDVVNIPFGLIVGFYFLKRIVQK
jgi:hypothetical protein